MNITIGSNVSEYSCPETMERHVKQCASFDSSLAADVSMQQENNPNERHKGQLTYF
jgi:hypothetical protein